VFHALVDVSNSDDLEPVEGKLRSFLHAGSFSVCGSCFSVTFSVISLSRNSFSLSVKVLHLLKRLCEVTF
jgi:hypothetical protein